jgi:dual specificity MAP kinase phosphatase
LNKLSRCPPVYEIDGATLSAALDHLATQPLPEPSQVFPWLHGLHPENAMQLAFFVNRKRSLRRIPKCLRAMTLVKVNGDLTRSVLKGAVLLDEVLAPPGWAFLEADPPDGFSVRNFHIQTAKLAPLSDIVVYGEGVDKLQLLDAAENLARAQLNWRKVYDPAQETPLFNTFVLSSKFSRHSFTHADI